MSAPTTGDIFKSKGGWPYPGIAPPVNTLADLFTKTDAASDGLRIGFSAWLYQYGSQAETSAYNGALVGEDTDKLDQAVAERIEQHFADYFWATELGKYTIVDSDANTVTSLTVGGQIVTKTPVRYWNADLTQYYTEDTINEWVDRGQVEPTVNYDRYYNDAEGVGNWEYLTDVSGDSPKTTEEVLPDLGTVRYWNTDLTQFQLGIGGEYQDANGATPKPYFDRYYADQSWQFITGIGPDGKPILGDHEYMPNMVSRTIQTTGEVTAQLLAAIPKLKNAVAYTAVRAKRRKEMLADRPARRLMHEAISEMRDGRLEGEQFSMKGASSIVEKTIEDLRIATEKNLKELSSDALIQGVDAISDGVRYTIMFPKDTYADGVKKFLAYFKDHGWTNSKFQNNWKTPLPSGYRGINTKWSVELEVEEGEKARETIEVQFHTQESFDTKEHGTHAIKEQIRVLENALADKKKKLEAAPVGTEAYTELQREVAAMTEELEQKNTTQKAIFEVMAASHTPPGSAEITL